MKWKKINETVEDLLENSAEERLYLIENWLNSSVNSLRVVNGNQIISLIQLLYAEQFKSDASNYNKLFLKIENNYSWTEIGV